MWPSISIGVIVFFVAYTVWVLWTQGKGAPYVPTSIVMVRKMLNLAEVGPDDVVCDLGCGDGRTIIRAARFYGAKAVGIELDPLRYLWCQLLVRVYGLEDRVQVICGDFFEQDLSEATVVTSYLLTVTNVKLQAKFREELKPGTRVVSNSFIYPELNCIRQDGNAHLYLID